MTFKIVELDLKEKLLKENDALLQLINIFFRSQNTDSRLEFVLKKIVTVVEKFFYFLCIY